MRALVVVNPSATTTSTRSRDVLLAALSQVLSVDVVTTEHRNHAAELASQARADRVDLVIGLGGDGTANEIVNGLLRSTSTEPIPDIGVIPGGSTNVLARNLGIPDDSIEATGALLDALRGGRRRPLSLGRLDERYFTFAAGVGFDADVIQAVEQERSKGRRATIPLYVRAGVRRFLAHSGHGSGSIALEEPDPVLSGLTAAIISNTSPWTYVGRRPVRPSPAASFETGLDLLALTSLHAVPVLRHLAQMALGSRGVHGRDTVQRHDLARIVLSAPEPVPVQVDGDHIGSRTRVVFESVPAALRVAC